MSQKEDFSTPQDSAIAGELKRIVLWNTCSWKPSWLCQEIGNLAGSQRILDDPLRPEGPLFALSKKCGHVGSNPKLESELTAAVADIQLIHLPLTNAPLQSIHHALIPILSNLNFHHIILHQRDGLDRLCALFAANPAVNLANDPSQIRSLLRKDLKTVSHAACLRAILDAAGLHCNVVAIEDLALPGDLALPCWSRLLTFLGLHAPANSTDFDACRLRLADEKASLRELPEPVLNVLTSCAPFQPNIDVPPALLRGSITNLSPKQKGMHVVKLNMPDRPLIKGDKAFVSGLVLPNIATESLSITCLQRGETKPLTWGLPSPGLKKRLPEIAGSGNARIKAFNVLCLPAHPAQLVVHDSLKNSDTPIAKITFAPSKNTPISGVLLAEWSIGFFPIPKVACTSVKEALFHLATGSEPSAKTHSENIHNFFGRQICDISAASFKFIVLRDPIKRFLSAYSNRVVHHKELTQQYIADLPATLKLDLSNFIYNPTLEQFIENFELYRKVPTITHHCQPMADFVPPLSSFDQVYTFEQLNQVCAEIGERTGRELTLPHSQSGGPKLNAQMLSEQSFERLLQIYDADYRLLEGIYERPKFDALTYKPV